LSAANRDLYDPCIVGAGYAGLNAAFVASEDLPAAARVLLLDKHHQAGGMWNDAYSYLCLHQPHQMFTASRAAHHPNSYPNFGLNGCVVGTSVDRMTSRFLGAPVP
jgi:cation diffusion facilitator CzcD-associated flavoprotein CzcO